jgi:hypothetical protein
MIYCGRVYQDGHEVAMVKGDDYDKLGHALGHYAAIYAQDGDVVGVVKERHKVLYRFEIRHAAISSEVSMV